MMLLGLVVLPALAAATLVGSFGFRWPGRWRSVFARLVHLGTCSAVLFLCAGVLGSVVVRGAAVHFDAPWSQVLGARFSLSADGLSLAPLLVLAAVFWLVAVGRPPKNRPEGHAALLLTLQVGAFGVVLAADALLMLACWQLLLLPAYFLVALWGGTGRAAAATRLLLGAFLGTGLLAAVLVSFHQRAGAEQVATWLASRDSALLDAWVGDGLLGRTARGDWAFWPERPAMGPLPRTFRLDLWARLGALGFFDASTEGLLGVLLVGAWALLLPLPPFHVWLTEAVAEASSSVAVVLASAFGPLAVYGAVRLGSVVPGLWQVHGPRLATWALVAGAYSAWVALGQKELHRLLAHARVGQLALAFAGVCIATVRGAAGGLLVACGWALAASVLLGCAGALDARTAQLDLEGYGGLARTAPRWTVAFAVASLSALAAPVLGPFVPAWLVVSSLATLPRLGAVAFALAVLFLAATYLWTFQRLATGPASPSCARLPDLTRGERVVLGSGLAMLVAFGLVPGPLVEVVVDGLTRALGRG